MEELAGILLKLLQKHYRVSLPGIGSFVVRSESAHIDEATNTMLPPSKKVIFSKQETWNDGLLESAYASRFNLSEKDAQERIRHLMMDIRFELDDKGRVNFPNFGCLRQGRQNNIELEQKVNLEEMLGLTPVPLGINPKPNPSPNKKANKAKRPYNPPKPRPQNDSGDFNTRNPLAAFKLDRQKLALVILAGLVGLTIAMILIYTFLGKSNQNEQALLPEKKVTSRYYELPSPTSTNEETEDDGNGNNEELYEQPIDPQPKRKPKPPAKTKHEEPPQRVIPNNAQYCIIITSVTSRIAAERKIALLKTTGYPNCHIAEIKNGRFRVAIDCYVSREHARSVLAVTKRSVNDAWILEK